MPASPAVQYAAFLRAINVAGHAVVKMTDLQRAFEAAGCQSVRTIVQSGNVLFECPEGKAPSLFDRIHDSMRESLGLETTVFFRSLSHLQHLVKVQPFCDLLAGPDVKLYVSFLASEPALEPAFPIPYPKEAMDALHMRGLDVFVVSRRFKGRFGFPNSFVERVLGVPATTRNWTTVTKIAGAVGVP